MEPESIFEKCMSCGHACHCNQPCENCECENCNHEEDAS